MGEGENREKPRGDDSFVLGVKGREPAELCSLILLRTCLTDPPVSMGQLLGADQHNPLISQIRLVNDKQLLEAI